MSETRPFVVLSPFPKNAAENHIVDTVVNLTPAQVKDTPTYCIAPAIDSDIQRAVVVKADSELRKVVLAEESARSAVDQLEQEKAAVLARLDAQLREARYSAAIALSDLASAQAKHAETLAAFPDRGASFRAGGAIEP